MCVAGHTFFVTQFVSFKDANTFEVFYSKDLAAEQIPLACKKESMPYCTRVFGAVKRGRGRGTDTVTLVCIV